MRALTVLPTHARPCTRVRKFATPSIGETAKTVVSTVHHGTLSTLTQDGTPLGTYVAYVLDSEVRKWLNIRRQDFVKWWYPGNAVDATEG